MRYATFVLAFATYKEQQAVMDWLPLLKQLGD